MPKQPKPEMLVLGMMSGTSADGIDVALARISGAPPALAVRLEGHHHVGFAKDIREAILRIANGGVTTSSEISQLNFLLGEELARAAIAACAKWRVPLGNLSLIRRECDVWLPRFKSVSPA
jgi:anhydro-N-acetylmuramic acid kinase